MHKMEYYLEIKRNKVLIYAIIWINHKNIMLSERSHMKKNHILPEPIYTRKGKSRKDKSIET